MSQKFMFALSLITAVCLVSSVAYADLEDFEIDLGRFTTWDSESGTLTATLGTGVMELTAGTTGSNVGVEHYTIAPDTYYMVTVDVTVLAGGASPFWFEVGVRSGNHTAADFDANPGSWFIPGKWEYGAVSGTDSQWPETENGTKVIGMSVLSGPSDTVLSFGLKLGGSGAPTVQIDNVHITKPTAAVTVDFDEDPYAAWNTTIHGFGFGDTTGTKSASGVMPQTVGTRLYCPGWMGSLGDGNCTTSRETTLVDSGPAAWMVTDAGSWGDASPVVGPITTTAGTVYVANFWMLRQRSGAIAWTNDGNDYNCHVAWRLADDPNPGAIEGWPGAIGADAFHLICEGASNTERNYAPDIYAPGSGVAIDAADPSGSRYSSMAFTAADDSTWLEFCVRTMKGGVVDSSDYVLDDLQLFTHGPDEGLAVDLDSLY